MSGPRRNAIFWFLGEPFSVAKFFNRAYISLYPTPKVARPDAPKGVKRRRSDARGSAKLNHRTKHGLAASPQ